MNETWRDYYDQLLLEIDCILRSGSTGTEQIEAWFRCTLGYWTRLRTAVRQTGFASDSEETHFFKTIKPRFTGRLEYYTLLYNFELFHPIDEPAELEFYCCREQQKITRFRSEHQAFLRYSASGKTDKDTLFFLRRNDAEEARPYARVFDQGAEFSSAYDWILTLELGYNLYSQFLCTQLQSLHVNGKPPESLS
jgi:hypothetical protein